MNTHTSVDSLIIWLYICGHFLLLVNETHGDFGCNSLNKNSDGTIEPRSDIVLLVNSTFEAKCIFDVNKLTLNDVYFIKVTNVEGKMAKTQISHQVENESAISIRVTENEPIEYALNCMENKTNSSGKGICRRFVTAGYLPGDVQNFSCTSENWDNLNCTWDILPNPVKVLYRLTYVVPEFLDDSKCPNWTIGSKFCYMDHITTPQFPASREFIRFKFIASNKLGNRTFEYLVNIREAVIPNAPEKLIVISTGPFTFNVTWRLPILLDSFPANIIAQLQYRQYGSLDWITSSQFNASFIAFNKPRIFKTNVSVNYAFTDYEFQVRLHTGVGVVRADRWSKPAYVAVRSGVMKSILAPETTAGSFEIGNSLDSRKIYIYFSQLKPELWNGPNLHYVVRAFTNSSDSPIHAVNVTSDRTYATFTDMGFGEIRFAISSVNDLGESNNSSIIRVASRQAMIDLPEIVTAIAYAGTNTTDYHVFWTPPNSFSNLVDGVVTYTVFWCISTAYEGRCENQLNWQTISDTTSLNVSGSISSKYLFGVSANVGNVSSGIKWVGCVAAFNKQPPALDSVLVVGSNPTWVDLKWELNCPVKVALPISYNISYCEVDNCISDMERCDVLNVFVGDNTKNSVRIGSLLPYTYYMYSISAMTQVGPNKWSDPTCYRTNPDKPSGPPKSIKVTNKGSTWVHLQWEPVKKEHRNGQITGYNIQLVPVGQMKKSEALDINTNADVLALNASDLQPYMTYNASVRACTSVGCGEATVSIPLRTNPGVPDDIDRVDVNMYNGVLTWDHDGCNGPKCKYQVRYRVNDSVNFILAARRFDNQSSVNFVELGVNCSQDQTLEFSVRAIGFNESFASNWKDGLVTPCIPKGNMQKGWHIFIIVLLALLAFAGIMVVCYFGFGRIRRFIKDIYLDPVLPDGLEPWASKDPNDVQKPNGMADGQRPPYKMLHSQISQISGNIDKKWRRDSATISIASEEKNLIDELDADRHCRNLSGESGSTNSSNTSGNSSGEAFVNGKNFHNLKSQESGVQTGINEDNFAHLRRRSPPPYVRQGAAISTLGNNYVALGSVPNLATIGRVMPTTMGITRLGSVGRHPSSPNLNPGELETDKLSAPGYMNTSEVKEGAGDRYLKMEMPILGPLGAAGTLPQYSRHNVFAAQIMGPGVSGKAASMPRLNPGYVTVDSHDSRPTTQGYVALADVDLVKGDNINPLLPGFKDFKMPRTPESELPTGAYVKVGTVAGKGHASLALPFQGQSDSKTSYVTVAEAAAIARPDSEPSFGNRQGTVPNSYVQLGDTVISQGSQWADKMPVPPTVEVQSTKRPNTSDGIMGHPINSGEKPPLVKMNSSGYVTRQPDGWNPVTVMPLPNNLTNAVALENHHVST